MINFGKRVSTRLSVPLLALLWLSVPSAQAEEAGETIDPAAMTMTFEDNFDTLDVSAWGPGTKWIAHTPWQGDFGGARFANPGKNSPFRVERGELRIEATRDAQGDWQSGLLASVDAKGLGFAQQYGYFELRAKLPTGAGVWPAFWLIGKDRSKVTAEIDIMEFYGDKPGGYSSVVHVWRRGEGEKNYSEFQRIPAFAEADPAEYHTYGVKVDADTISMYFDRKLMWQTPTQPEHRQPMYILFNLALVDGVTKELTPDPSHMFVDYVRAYKLDN